MQSCLEKARRGNLVALGLLTDLRPTVGGRPAGATGVAAMGANRGTVDVTKLPEYTVEDVGKHSNNESCWLIIDGLVYDVTPYLALHPGGEAILRNAGKDSSLGFHGPQHPATVPDTAKKFLIGRVRA